MQIQLLKKEMSLTLTLASPLIAALLAQTTMEIVNALMLGRLGPLQLAAGSLGIAVFFMMLVLCIGLFSASGVLIARSYGSGQHLAISQIISQSIYLAIFLGIACMCLLWYVPTILLLIGEQPEIVSLSAQFLQGLLWGMPPLLMFIALREFVSAMSYTKIIMLLSLCAAPLTALGNYVLIYGKLGFPALGISGIGYSTAFMQWCLLLAMLMFIYKNKKLKPYLFNHFQPLMIKHFWEMIRLGTPVSVTMGLEAGLFSVTTLLMGYFGAISLASHQIALQCATFAFMFPLGIAQATAIRVGQSRGAENVQQAKYAGYAGLFLGIGAASLTAFIFLAFPMTLIHFFISTDAPDYRILVTTAVHFLWVMTLFQLLDAIQVIMSGALRGLKDTFVPMWLGLLSYWVSGLISGYYLAFVLKLGGIGLWWGLGIGIGVSGILLLLRFVQRIKYEEQLAFPG